MLMLSSQQPFQAVEGTNYVKFEEKSDEKMPVNGRQNLPVLSGTFFRWKIIMITQILSE